MAQIHTQKKDGAFHTVINSFGLGPWDESVYIQAGLKLEGNSSAKFYDYAEYPVDRDRYKRHLVFSTLESPNLRDLSASGKALIQCIELEEYSAQFGEIEQIEPAVANSVGQMAVQYAYIRREKTT